MTDQPQGIEVKGPLTEQSLEDALVEIMDMEELQWHKNWLASMKENFAHDTGFAILKREGAFYFGDEVGTMQEYIERYEEEIAKHGKDK